MTLAVATVLALAALALTGFALLAAVMGSDDDDDDADLKEYDDWGRLR
jgi:hypothetical protein